MQPEITEASLISLCRCLLSPETAKYTVFSQPASLEELIDGAIQVEALLKATPAPPLLREGHNTPSVAPN